MSGFEIVGVVLGGLPIVLKVAEDYKRGLEPLVKWHRYKLEFRTFINDVDIEKQMFDALVDRLLQYTDLSSDQKQMLMTGLDTDGWCQREVDEALKKRLGESYDACMYLLKSMEENLLKLEMMLCLKDGSVDWVKPGEDRWVYQRKRLSHSFSKKGPETVASLMKNNRKFRDLLDVLDRRVAAEAATQKPKAVSKNTTFGRLFGLIRQNATSLHSALQNAWKCGCETPHLASLQLQGRISGDWSSRFIMAFNSSHLTQQLLYHRHKVLVTVKQMEKVDSHLPASIQSLVLEPTTEAPRPLPAPIQNANGGYLTRLRSNLESQPQDPASLFVSSSAQRSLSAPTSTSFGSQLKRGFKSHNFLKSSMSVSSSTSSTQIFSNTSETSSPKPKKTVRMSFQDSTVVEASNSQSASALCGENTGIEEQTEIKDLCSCLTSNPHTPCLGYLYSPNLHRYEFRSITDDVPIQAETKELISLEKLLDRSARGLRITRRQRFRLTSVLASSLLQLQTTPWLKKNMDKSNIFFEYQGPEVMTEHPYLCYYFPSTKSCPSPLPTETLATLTPAAVRFATKASLNQLGILLLELCFGETIESRGDIRDNYLLEDGTAHNQTNFLAAHEWISEVEHEAGLEFKNAVSNCFNFDVKPDWSDIKFTQSIYDGVVQPLETILSDLGWADTS